MDSVQLSALGGVCNDTGTKKCSNCYDEFQPDRSSGSKDLCPECTCTCCPELREYDDLCYTCAGERGILCIQCDRNLIHHEDLRICVVCKCPGCDTGVRESHEQPCCADCLNCSTCLNCCNEFGQDGCTRDEYSSSCTGCVPRCSCGREVDEKDHWCDTCK